MCSNLSKFQNIFVFSYDKQIQNRPFVLSMFAFLSFLQSPEPSGIIDLRSFHVTEGNYTKRKHVFKLTSAPLPTSSSSSSSTTNITHITSPSSLPSSATSNSSIVSGTELLIQADSQQDMKLWMDTLRKASCLESASSVVSEDIFNLFEYLISYFG